MIKYQFATETCSVKSRLNNVLWLTNDVTVLVNRVSELEDKGMFASNNEITQRKQITSEKMLILHNVAPFNKHNVIRVSNLHLSITF